MSWEIFLTTIMVMFDQVLAYFSFPPFKGKRKVDTCTFVCQVSAVFGHNEALKAFPIRGLDLL